ncbi:tudor domain-containing protein 5 isoform X1 [Anastrepha obliqua]|uniref:tudor domain-containing protein 5 isoform X1 n=1 Tax=Anastrepha obliqua TaxID=95512 RepID=UPI00240A070A|nr:tudor domain-containing protein 5 isoform X1 [Anastrepha obliqua]
MEIGYLQEIKLILKSLVLSCPDVITIDALNRDFRSTEGSSIPYKKLGFQTLELFLRSISDTIEICGSGPSATVSIVHNEKSDHIRKMVCQQKKTRARPRAKPPRLRIPRNDFNNSKISHSAGQKSVSNQFTSDNLPTSNIRFSHSVTRSTPRNTVIKCQALELPEGFAVNRFANEMQNLNGMRKENLGSPLPSNPPKEQRHTIKAEKLTPQVCQIPRAHSHKLVEQTQGNIANPPATETDSFERLFEQCKINDDNHTSGPLRELNIEIEKPNLPTIHFPQKVHTKMLTNNTVTRSYACTTQNVFDLNKSHDEQKMFDDMEEAVPAYAANNLVFRMDFPENTMTFGKKIPEYKLPDNIRSGSIIGIFISEIHSPFKFWFHIYKEHHELDMLMLQIERFYMSLEPDEFCIPRMCICPGQVCAALYKGLWHRAEVLSAVIENKTKVLFVDYGTVSEVSIDNIKFLLTAFATLPKQAIRGSLSHIRPKNLHWCQESIHYFLSLSCELMLYGQVSEIYEAKRIIYMVLCDTNGSEVVQINRELVENGFALYDEEWQKSDKGEQRLHHLREHFPTFSMLELGEYPSLAELIDLKNKGIDYECIIDHNVYHPGRLDLCENVPDTIRKLPFQLLTTNPFRRDIYLQLHHLI